MTCHLDALCWDANHPGRLARFWAGVLDVQHIHDGPGGTVLVPTGDADFRIRFIPNAGPRTAGDQAHLDLTSTSLDHQQQIVSRSLRLGARYLDVGQRPEEGHVVLADPEGTAFCVIEPGNAFLADCGSIGALSCDGSRQVGQFWSAALDWPLVWDQDQETAMRSPNGGPKVTWGGPPLTPKVAKNRLHLDLVPTGDQQAELGRLLRLGATPVDIGQGEVNWAVMADPDGNEFCLGPAR